jgi:sugar transferase (PEP-CTERM/EpsH1 system associated)
MKILFLAYEPPYPPNDGGRIRTYNILKLISKKHDVTLLAFQNPENELDFRTYLGSFCNDLLIFPREKLPDRNNYKKILEIGRKYPIDLERFSSSKVRKFLNQAANQKLFDLAHIDQIYLTQYWPELAHIACVITHHNIEAEIQKRFLFNHEKRLLPIWWIKWIEYLRWKRYEIDVSQKMQALVAVSERNALYFREHVPQVKTFVVPNGVDTNQFKVTSRNPLPGVIIYMGRMDYKPNIDAVIWFSNEILPTIRNEVSHTSFWIVGRNPTHEIQELAKIPGVIVTGEVPDTRPYYEKAQIFVTPIRMGSGTRLKILEAMSMQMPIISTSVGAEGINITHRKDILIADTPKEFAYWVVKLLQDDRLCDSLAKQARATVTAYYDWQSIIEIQELAYEHALAQKR